MADSEKIDELIAGQATLLERSNSIIRELKDQNKHLEKINGSIAKHGEQIIALNTTVYGKGSDEGLCSKVDKNSAKLNKLLLIVAILMGTGVSGFGISELVKVLTN